MNYRPPPPPPPEPTHHYCVSGKPWCSPISSCEGCFRLLRGAVVPRIITESGMNGRAVQKLYELVVALRQRGIDPAQLGVPVDMREFDPTRQVEQALVAYEEGFKLLHQRMATDPALAHIVATPVASGGRFAAETPIAEPNADPEAYAPYPTPPAWAPSYGGQAPQGIADPNRTTGGGFGPAPAAPAPPGPAPVSDAQPPVEGTINAAAAEQLGVDPPKAPPIVPAIRPDAPRVDIRTSDPAAKARVATRRLDAEEIALAGIAVDDPGAPPHPGPNGVPRT